MVIVDYAKPVPELFPETSDVVSKINAMLDRSLTTMVFAQHANHISDQIKHQVCAELSASKVNVQEVDKSLLTLEDAHNAFHTQERKWTSKE